MVLYWIKENKYYKLFEQKTLFGTIDVVCVWGRIGGNLGGCQIISCDNDEDVEFIVNSIKRKRKYRGYILFE
jgi:predicted DNA-binding WGR domain protein